MRKTLLLMAAGTICTSGMAGEPVSKIVYPDAPKDATVDEYFGISVPDPYRPLENDTAAVTLEWVKAENDVTDRYLSAIPFRDNVRKRLTELNNYHKTGLPSKENDGRYYYSENDGLKNQSVIYRKNTLDSSPELFLDPNTLSKDGTVALTGLFQSKDGKYTAYTVSRSGSDWTEIFVMDTETKELLPDHVEWAKFTSAEWDGNDGFFYSTYPRPEQGKEFSNSNENHRIFYHKIGTPQSEDKLVFEDVANPFHFHTAQVPEGAEGLLFVYDQGQGMGSGLRMLDRKTGKWTVMETTQEYPHEIIGVRDGNIYIMTSYGAPRKRLMTAPVSAPQRQNWKELIPEKDDVLMSALFSGDKLLLKYQKDAWQYVDVANLDGSKYGEIKLPGYGTVSLSASSKSPEAFYLYTSFTTPASIYEYDSATGETKFISRPEINGFNPDDYVTEQVFYPSADGTKIPMFLTYRKGLEKNGDNPVYLYGYGGFDISLNPGFNANRLLWLENGGIYAQANLRGGGEYGEAWHEAGIKQNKLNVFDDFIAAAEYLEREGYSRRDLTAMVGGSNGGLLVGATVNLRPDICKVAIPQVGVMDMMRYHLFTIGWNWASDYGTSADSEAMARYLLGYSPLHTIRNDGTPYPAILVTTADHDDRVVPAHSFKYAATLQAANTGDAPKLIRIESEAGHGAGKPMSKVIDEYADIYSFIFQNMNLQPENSK